MNPKWLKPIESVKNDIKEPLAQIGLIAIVALGLALAALVVVAFK